MIGNIRQELSLSYSRNWICNLNEHWVLRDDFAGFCPLDLVQLWARTIELQRSFYVFPHFSLILQALLSKKQVYWLDNRAFVWSK